MKILVDGRVLKHKVVSGVERYTSLLIKYLSRIEGIELDVLSPSSESKINQHLWEHFCLPVKALEYDLLFCPANIAPVWIPEGVRLVVTLHSVAYLTQANSYSKMFREYYRKVVPHVIEIANHIVTVSNSERDRILQYYPQARDKISVIYNGVDESFYSTNRERKGYILSVVSHLSIKNMNSVIDAFNLIKDRLFYNLKIVVSNPNKGRNTNYRLSERIEIFYNLDDDRLIDMYKNALLFVMPSKYESFCFPVVEALASGTPVVCTPLEAIREIAEGAVFFSEGFDSKSLSRAMYSVLSNPYTMENLRNRGYEVVKRYRWEDTASNYVSLFKRVIRENEG